MGFQARARTRPARPAASRATRGAERGSGGGAGARRLLGPVFGLLVALMLAVLGGGPVEGQASDRIARVEIAFTGNFVQEALAAGETLPADTTFASVAFAVHASTVSFFNAGETASAGLKSFAETGSTSLLVDEFLDGTDASFVYRGTDVTFPLTATQEQSFGGSRASRQRDHLTFLVSFSQSPDWFVGARNIDLRPGGDWETELEVDLFAWDAGTDSGADWTSADAATDPQANITSLKGAGRFSTTRIGTVTISLNVPPSDDGERRVRASDAGSLDGMATVSWVEGESLGAVDFDRFLVAWKSDTEEFQAELDGDRVKVVMGRNVRQTTIDGLTNGTEYTFRVAHANAVGPARHHSAESTATPAARVRELVSNFAQAPNTGRFERLGLRTNKLGRKFLVNQFTTGATARSLGSVTLLRVVPLKAGDEEVTSRKLVSLRTILIISSRQPAAAPPSLA